MGIMRNLRRELRSAVGRPVAYQINDGRGAAVAPVLERVIRGARVQDGELLDAMADIDESGIDARKMISEKLAAPMIIPGGKNGKATALISVRGVALYDTEFQPYAFSTLLLAQTVTALGNDPEIGTIILDIDSPGGVVTGTPEAADAIYMAAKGGTNVVALINPLCASAAYWIASQASEIVAVPSADIGSLGVFLLHCDASAALEMSGLKPTFIFAGPHKVEGNEFAPLDDSAREHFQSEVDMIYGDFLKAVARGRGVPVSKVAADFGGGRTLMAKAALKAGMIDRIATINAAMARWGVSQPMLEGRRRGEAETPETVADAHPALADPLAADITTDAPGESEEGGETVVDEFQRLTESILVVNPSIEERGPTIQIFDNAGDETGGVVDFVEKEFADPDAATRQADVRRRRLKIRSA